QQVHADCRHVTQQYLVTHRKLERLKSERIVRERMQS
ncbi:MAG: hypothetical protein ACI9RU_000087, partial [Litorivivens sp.]